MLSQKDKAIAAIGCYGYIIFHRMADNITYVTAYVFLCDATSSAKVIHYFSLFRNGSFIRQTVTGIICKKVSHVLVDILLVIRTFSFNKKQSHYNNI